MSQRDSGLGEEIGHRTNTPRVPTPIPSEDEEYQDTQEEPGNETIVESDSSTEPESLPEQGQGDAPASSQSPTPPPSPTPSVSRSPSPDINMANQPASGSQLNSLPKFEGKEGLEVRNFLEAAENARGQFNWGHDTTIAAVIYRMTGPAQDWIRGKKMMGATYEGAAGWRDLKTQMLERFSPVITSATAVDAVKDLRQHHDETVSEFHDRIIHALDRKNHTYTPVQKTEDAYLAAFRADLVTFFLGGLRESISKKVMGVPEPPNTPDAALQAARAAEAAEARQKVPIMAVDETEPEELEVDAVQRKKTQCFNCQGFGHWSRECPSPRRGKAKPGTSTPVRMNNPFLRKPQDVLIGGKRPVKRLQASEVEQQPEEPDQPWELEEDTAQAGNE